jgi:hypothetical protein
MTLNVFHYLNQGEWWYPHQKPRVLIATEMNDGWRRNAANLIIRHAAIYELHYASSEMNWLLTGLGGTMLEVLGHDDNGDPVLGSPVSMMPSGDMACDAFDRELDDRAHDPEKWIKTTTLYKALMDGLE